MPSIPLTMPEVILTKEELEALFSITAKGSDKTRKDLDARYDKGVQDCFKLLWPYVKDAYEAGENRGIHQTDSDLVSIPPPDQKQYLSSVLDKIKNSK